MKKSQTKNEQSEKRAHFKTQCTEAEAKVAHTFLPFIGSKLGDVNMEILSVCKKYQGQCFPSHSEYYSVLDLYL